MIQNQNIICFGFAEWDNPYRTNQHHVMEQLAAANRVLFIESLGLRRPTFQKKDVTRLIKRLFKWFRGVRKVSENLNIYAPLVIPFHKYGIVRTFNNWFLKRQLDIVIAFIKFNKPIIWTYVPNAVNYFGRWDEQLTVYHCVDDIAANPLVPKQVFLEMESELLKNVDIVFTTSKTLFEEKRKYNPNTYYLPNVADFSHFNSAKDPGTIIPGEINSLPQPRLGFYGAISGYKLDLNLIKTLAQKHPEWSFVLIGEKGEGEKEIDLSKLLALKNVHYFGGKPYGEIPSYLAGFDVCLLPSIINDYTRNMFPMKFFEYLATGKPVVSTGLEALIEFKDFFYLSYSYDEFEQNVIGALGEKSQEKVNSRVELAKQYTWANRMGQMSEIITETLRRKMRRKE